MRHGESGRASGTGRRAGFQRALLIASGILLGGAVLPVPSLGAQSVARVIPQIGLYAPMSDLGEVRDDRHTLVEAGRRASSLALGLGLELAPLPRSTALRAAIGYATNARVPVGGFDCPECEARNTVLTGTVSAVLRPVPRLLLAQPYFLVGAGVKRYDFEPRTVEGDAWIGVLRDQTRPALQVGAGMELTILGHPTQWEISGSVSSFRTGGEQGGVELAPGVTGERSTQADLFLMFAVPLP